MSRTFAHVPFRHAFPVYVAHYSRERTPLDHTERLMYIDAGPDWPRDGDKHWSKRERRVPWEVGAVNRSGYFTRTMAKQRLRAEIAAQMADVHPDRDDEDWLAYISECDFGSVHHFVQECEG